jgi:transposase
VGLFVALTDVPQAEALIEALPADVVMADTAYDSARLRDAISDKGPSRSSQTTLPTHANFPLDKGLYGLRHLIECCFSKLKQFRSVATRYEKTARNYRAVDTIAAIVIWVR